jgi:hypothetical protein
MPFTAEELANLANATHDFHIKKGVQSQIKQVRPLMDNLNGAKEGFGGGKEYVVKRVKGQYTSRYRGYSHDDEQVYENPANIKQVRGKWYEISSGIQVTYTELKANGIHVENSRGSSVSRASDAELYQLADILEDKFEDLEEGSNRSFAEMCWRDGTQDSKVFPGMQSIITTTPTVGVTFGLDRAQHTWFRNRATLAINVATPANQVLVQTLQKEMRQLRRFGTPSHKMYAGSDLLDAFEMELRAKGNYTLDGWAKTGKIDASVADVAFKGVMLEYDPLLDDLGFSKYLYVVDHNNIKLMPMKGEENKIHTPERPPEKYVLYRAKTWTGLLFARQLNTSGVYAIA